MRSMRNNVTSGAVCYKKEEMLVTFLCLTLFGQVQPQREVFCYEDILVKMLVLVFFKQVVDQSSHFMHMLQWYCAAFQTTQVTASQGFLLVSYPSCCTPRIRSVVCVVCGPDEGQLCPKVLGHFVLLGACVVSVQRGRAISDLFSDEDNFANGLGAVNSPPQLRVLMII